MKPTENRSMVVMRRWFVLALMLLAVGGSGAGVASAAELSAPAAASWAPNRYDLIVRGHDGLIYHKYWNSGMGPVNGWSNWGSIGAPPAGAASSPTVTSPSPDILQVFVRGGDGRIWNNHWTYGQGSAPGGWSGWGAVPNTGNATWAPTAANGPDPHPDVFYTGTDGATYYTRYDPQLGWVPPVSLGGTTWGSPAVTTTGGSRFQLIVRGSDSRIYHKIADNPFAWTPWGLIPNTLTSMSPAISFGEDGQQNQFFRDYNNGTMYHQYYRPGVGWVGPGAIPNVSLVSSPAAARLHVYYRSANGDVLGTHYDPVQGWVFPSSKGQPNSDGRLYREQSSTAVYLMEGGIRSWVTSPEVAQAAGLNLGAVEVLPDGSLTSIPRGANITMASLDESAAEHGDVAEASSSSYDLQSTMDFLFHSEDARAQGNGTVKWFRGKDKTYIRKGIFTVNSHVWPTGPVACLWAKVEYEYWKFGSITVGFPPTVGGSVEGASTDSGYFVRCRNSSELAPPALKLRGISYTRAFIRKLTITACISNSPTSQPKECAHQVVPYKPRFFGLIAHYPTGSY